MTDPKHTDTSRSGDLVETLLCVDRGGVLHSRRPKQTHPICAKASDRIEADGKHIAELDGRAMEYLLLSDKQAMRIAKLEAALRLFLALIDDPDYDFGELCEEFVPIARAALGEKQ